MSRAVGEGSHRRPRKQKSWKMKAAQEAGEEYYDPTREDNIKGRTETRLALREEHLEDPTVALDKALKCVEHLYQRSWPKVVWGRCFLHWLALASSKVCGESRSRRASGPTWIRWFAHSFHGMKYGPHGELFFFLI